MDYLYLFLILALLAEILGTIGGFGSSMYFVPIAAFFLDFHSVLGVTALFHLASNVSKLALFRKGIDRTLFLNLGIPAIALVILGAALSDYIETYYLELSLSIFLITMSILLMIFPNLKLKATKRNTIIGGGLSGFVAGLVGTGGAIRGLTLSSFALKPEIFIATSALIDLGVDASRSVVYFTHGYVHTHDLYLLPLLLIVSITGTFIGKLIVERMTPGYFRSIVLILVCVAGIVTIFRIL